MRHENYFLELANLTAGDVVLRHEDPISGPGWLLFQSPTQTLVAEKSEDVAEVLAKAADHAKRGGWSAGFLTYEAGAAFHPEITVHEPDWTVLAWFTLYDQPPTQYRELLPEYEPVEVQDLESEWDLPQYEQAFEQVKQALAEGETYQVNLTFRQRFRLTDAARFFASRCGIDPPKYAAFIHGGDWQVASFSPELLFERRGAHVETRPMKGTALVPAVAEDLETVSQALTEDPKSIAENIMIVDMVRNDLGSICEVGSVQTPKLLEVERHRGLLQMTSTVTGRCSRGADELLSALFPAASITGAPKVATTRLIRRFETSPRHLYCGAIGVMTQEWQRFNVAIRTALVRGDRGEFGVGSGVVWDSQLTAEYQECLDKRELLLREGKQWELIEALGAHQLDEPDLVEAHLRRLSDSASSLGILLDLDAIRHALEAVPRTKAEARQKVRISVRYDARFDIAVGPSAIDKSLLTAAVAKRPLASADPNLRIKTNSRRVLDEFLEAHPSVDEVLLYNEREEITEFCRGNVLLELDGRCLTPRPESGCLPGVTVSKLIEEGQAEWSVLPLKILERCSGVYFANSVVGLVPVRISDGA